MNIKFCFVIIKIALHEKCKKFLYLMKYNTLNMSMEGNLQPFKEIITDRLFNRPTDQRGHMEVTLPIHKTLSLHIFDE